MLQDTLLECYRPCCLSVTGHADVRQKKLSHKVTYRVINELSLFSKGEEFGMQAVLQCACRHSIVHSFHTLDVNTSINGGGWTYVLKECKLNYDTEKYKRMKYMLDCMSRSVRRLVRQTWVIRC